jgi:peptidoglycan/LPS O-acetylase OafA/YrhL
MGLQRGLIAVGLAALVGLALIGRTGGLARPAREPAITVLMVNLLCLAVVGIVRLNAGSRASAFFRRPRLVYLGQISYGPYLYHFVIKFLGDDIAEGLAMGGRLLWREALTIAATFGMAALSWCNVERPVLAWKDRFAYREALGARTPHLRTSLAVRAGYREVAA